MTFGRLSAVRRWSAVVVSRFGCPSRHALVTFIIVENDYSGQ
jgi:hypothetical protein